VFLRLLSASSALRLRQIAAVRKARFEHEHEHGIPMPWGGRMEQSSDWRPLTEPHGEPGALAKVHASADRDGWEHTEIGRVVRSAARTFPHPLTVDEVACDEGGLRVCLQRRFEPAHPNVAPARSGLRAG